MIHLPPEADAVARLEARLERIESRLDRLVRVLDQAEAAVAMVTDSVDAAVRGVDVDTRARAALQLVQDTTEPQVLERLSAVARQLDDLAPAIELAARLEDTIGMAADAFDAWAGEQAARGADLDERARVATGLIDRLTEPDTAAALTAMVDALPKLEPVVRLATTFEPTTAMLFDMLDEHVRAWQARDIDAEARFLQVASLVERLTDPEFHQHLEALLDAAPGLMAATRTGELFGVALDEATARPPAPMGPFALLRALSDPDVQRAVGLAVAVARTVGGRLPTTPLTRT